MDSIKSANSTISDGISKETTVSTALVSATATAPVPVNLPVSMETTTAVVTTPSATIITATGAIMQTNNVYARQQSLTPPKTNNNVATITSAIAVATAATSAVATSPALRAKNLNLSAQNTVVSINNADKEKVVETPITPLPAGKSKMQIKPRDAFWKDLYQFHERRCTPITNLPKYNGHLVDLYQLYNEVTERGGFNKVNLRDEWDEIYTALDNLPEKCVNGTAGIKYIYRRFLDKYERLTFFGEDPDKMEALEAAIDSAEMGSGRSRSRYSHLGSMGLSSIFGNHNSMLNSVPMSYNYRQHIVNIDKRRHFKLSMDLYRGTSYEKLLLSLLSPLPNEQDFAINVCTLMTNEPKHTLRIGECPKIVDILLAHIGVYADYTLRKLFEHVYTNIRRHSQYSFWRDLLHDKPQILELYTDEQAWIDNGLINVEHKEDPIKAALLEDCYKLDFLNLRRSDGTHDYMGQRVLQVTQILRSLSFYDENLLVLARNRTFWRYLVMGANIRWNNVHIQALETAGNVATEFELQDPTTDELSRNLLATLCEGIESPDRAVIINCLEILYKLCSKEGNEDYVNKCLNLDFYHRICLFLSLNDVMLLIFTLEAIYALTSMGSRSCSLLMQVRGVVDQLVALITVEAQSYGPDGCILMRVVEIVPGNMLPIVAQNIATLQNVTGLKQQPQQQTQQIPMDAQVSATVGGNNSSSNSETAATPMPMQLPIPHPSLPQVPIAPVQVTTSTTVAISPSTTTTVTPTPPPSFTHDDEQYALAWLGATFERAAANDSHVEQQELYRMYLAHCQKSGKHSVVNHVQFPRLVRLIYNQSVGPMVVRRSDGTELPGFHYVGIRMRAQPLPMQCKANTTLGPSSFKTEVMQPVRKKKKLKQDTAATLITTMTTTTTTAATTAANVMPTPAKQAVIMEANTAAMTTKIISADDSDIKMEANATTINATEEAVESTQEATATISDMAKQETATKEAVAGTTTNTQPSTSLIKSLLANKVNQRQQKQKELVNTASVIIQSPQQPQTQQQQQQPLVLTTTTVVTQQTQTSAQQTIMLATPTQTPTPTPTSTPTPTPTPTPPPPPPPPPPTTTVAAATPQPIKVTSNAITALVNNQLMQHTPVKVGQTTIKPLNPQLTLEKKQIITDSVPPPLAPLSGTTNVVTKDASGRTVIIANQSLVELPNTIIKRKLTDENLESIKRVALDNTKIVSNNNKNEETPVTPSKNAANLYAEMAASILEDEDLADIPPLATTQNAETQQQQQKQQQHQQQQQQQQQQLVKMQLPQANVQRQILFQGQPTGAPQHLKLTPASSAQQIPTAMATIKTEQGLQTVPVILQPKGLEQNQPTAQIIQQVIQQAAAVAQPAQQQQTQYVLATNQQGQTYLVAQPAAPSAPPTQTVLVTQTPQQQSSGTKTIIILQQQNTGGQPQQIITTGPVGGGQKMFMTTAQGQQVLVTQRPPTPQQQIIINPQTGHATHIQHMGVPVSVPGTVASGSIQQRQLVTAAAVTQATTATGQISPSLLSQLNQIPATIKLHQPQPTSVTLTAQQQANTTPATATISRIAGKTVQLVQTPQPVAPPQPPLQIPQLQQHQSIIQQHIISGPTEKRQVLLGAGRAIEIKETLITQTQPPPQQSQLNSQTIITTQPAPQMLQQQQHIRAVLEQQQQHPSIIQQKITVPIAMPQQQQQLPQLSTNNAAAELLPNLVQSTSAQIVNKPLTSQTAATAVTTTNAPKILVTAANIKKSIETAATLSSKMTVQSVAMSAANAATTTTTVAATSVATTTPTVTQPQQQQQPQVMPLAKEANKIDEKLNTSAPSNTATTITSTSAQIVAAAVRTPTPIPAPTAPPAPTLPAIPPDVNWLFICDWRNCPRRKFKSLNDLLHHACTVHCPDHLDPAAEIFCQWGTGPGLCDNIPRKRYSLMTHLSDRHLTLESLRLAAQRRITTGIHNVAPTQPAVTIVRNVEHSQRVNSASPAPSTGSSNSSSTGGGICGSIQPTNLAGSSALHAIKRHTADFVNPKELMEENEGPVTKSIRLTAALILRNLVTYTTTAKRQLRYYEPHLANVAFSNMESSSALAQILFELNN